MNNSTTDTTSPEDAGDIPLSRILVGVLLFFIILVTVVGNTLVLVAVARDKRLHTVFNILIVNLAITDVSVGLVPMTFFAVFNVLQEWPFGEFLCGLWIFCDFGMTFASIFTLLAISLDRYWSVLWSNHYRIHHNRRKAIIATVTIWVSMLVLWVPPFTVDRINNSREGECFYDPAKNQVFVIVVAVVGYHGSTVVMLFCYIKVFLFLRNRSKTGPLHSRSGGTMSVIAETGPARKHTEQIVKAESTHTTSDHQQGCDVGANGANANSKDKIQASTQQMSEPGERRMKFLSMQTLPSSSRGHFRPEDARTRGVNNDGVQGSKDQLPATQSPPSSEKEEQDNKAFQNDSEYEGRVETRPRSDRVQSVSGGPAATGENRKVLVAQLAATTDGRDAEQKTSITSMLRREQKVFLTLSYIMVGYLICWMPFHVSFDIMAIDRSLVSEKFYEVTYWLAYCNSAINPFLYNFSSSEFNRAFKKLIGRR
ncbi:hypothetical protein BaRGS_00026967 [Batillaria attramentaria]|uniref:G-protein coupled receptors family 1 profile domain-containing protein n=1 Tax=Batillaria attramentaria TaxID=370345 RepID=A0ABD0K338_9CAEN